MRHKFLAISKAFAACSMLACSLTFSSYATDPTDACTSIMVGKKASADGSVITSHTCDGRYRTWIDIVPAFDAQRDTVADVYDGRMHTEYPSSTDGMKKLGQVPMPASTYRFVNTAYPCLNERQLAIGETTYSGRDTMVNSKGMWRIEELQRVALQQCSTAREAISLMGRLIKEYGYGDGGECLTIADPKEVWIFEVQGEGPDKIGGVWAAQRIPDDHIAVSANVSRIGEIDFNDPDSYMWSDNVKSVAKKMKLWDGKEPFSFWKAYSGGNYMGEPKNYSVRELFIMQQLAPSAGFTDELTELPVSVCPDKKVSIEDVSRLLGSYYEGTPLNLSGRLKIKNPKKKAGVESDEPDSIVSPRANPWMRPDEIAVYEALGDSAMHNIRTVSVPWCAYSTVIQCRDWLPDEVGGVAWIAFDNPGLSPRIPVFAGATRLPRLFGVCGQKRHRDDSALWHFREANRLATVSWGDSRKSLEPARDHFMQKALMELPLIENEWQVLTEAGEKEKAAALLNDYTADFLGASVMRWDALRDDYWKEGWKGF